MKILNQKKFNNNIYNIIILLYNIFFNDYLYYIIKLNFSFFI